MTPEDTSIHTRYKSHFESLDEVFPLWLHVEAFSLSFLCENTFTFKRSSRLLIPRLLNQLRLLHTKLTTKNKLRQRSAAASCFVCCCRPKSSTVYTAKTSRVIRVAPAPRQIPLHRCTNCCYDEAAFFEPTLTNKAAFN